MKVKPSVKLICEKCKIIKRKGRDKVKEVLFYGTYRRCGFTA